jgi:F0F1-type ATP synthase assembly protein I
VRKILPENKQRSLTPSENAAIIPRISDAEEQKIARRVIWLQVIAALTAASIVYSTKGTPQYAIAVLSGGGVSVTNGFLLAWRMSRLAAFPASEQYHSRDVSRQIRLLYFYAAERFLVVVLLLALCMAVLKLSPLAVLAGFVVGQSVLLIARLFLIRFKTEIVTKNV